MSVPKPTTGESFAEKLQYIRRLGDPNLRGYLMCVLGSMAVILMNNFQRGGPVSVVGPLVFAIPALFLRWTLAPPIFLIAALYFQVLPFGIPIGSEFPVPIAESHFLITDLMFMSAILIYLISQFRLYSLTDRAYPDEEARTAKQKKLVAETRPVESISPSELPQLLGHVALLVLAGQVVWLIWVNLEIAPRNLLPLRIRPGARSVIDAGGYQTSPELSRFITLSIALTAFVLVTRLVFGIWRLSRLSSLEGRQLLIDGSWNEQRRELARLETWKAWPRMSKLPKPKVSKPQKSAENERPSFTFAAAGRVVLILLGIFVFYLALLAIFVNWP